MMRHRPDAVADRLRRGLVDGVEQGTEPVGKQVGALRRVYVKRHRAKR